MAIMLNGKEMQPMIDGVVQNGIFYSVHHDAVAGTREKSFLLWRNVFIDPRDGNRYAVEQMPDGRLWMTESLRYIYNTHIGYNPADSSGRPYVVFQGGGQKELYRGLGGLYSAAAVRDAAVPLAPEGWRVPTETELAALLTSAEAYAYNYGHLKLKSVRLWNPGGTDDYNFRLLPGGDAPLQTSSVPVNLGSTANLWTSTAASNAAQNRFLHIPSNGSQTFYSDSKYFSVRLVRD